MATYELIETITLGSNAASVTFSDIPQTYTDLKILISVRSTYASTSGILWLRFNGDSGTNYPFRRLEGSGSAVSSNGTTAGQIGIGRTTGSTATANTFSNTEVYIPNYTGSTYKSVSSTAASENNAVAAQITATAGLWNNTSAITSLSVLDGESSNLVTNSSFSLYGIKKA